MRSKNPIIPGCLALSKQNFVARVDFAATVGNSVHIDVVDNEFVKGHTLPVADWPALKLEYVEAHLMVRRPIEYLAALKQAGVTRAIVQIESDFDLDELIETARKLDILIGFAINPDTNLNDMKKYLGASNYIQVMGAYPGKTGQEQLPQTSTAISFFHSLPLRLVVTVDIGVNAETIIDSRKNGATYFIASSAIYDHGDWSENYQQLDQAVREYDHQRA